MEGIDRYRLEVLAADLDDLVVSAGGLIVDRAMAGWEVCVVVAADDDRRLYDRAARILGARLRNRVSEAPCAPHVLAVAADVVVADAAVRQRVIAAADDPATEVLLWGAERWPRLNRRYVALRHRPSAAAQLFTSHALIAGGITACRPECESFYSIAGAATGLVAVTNWNER